MKFKIAILLSLFAAGFMMTSCEDVLEEEDFTYSLSSNNFYNTAEEANAAVMAPLDMMRLAYNSNWFATLEIQTEYCYPKGVYTGYHYNGIVNSTHETRLATNWTYLYRAISYCNTALDKLPAANAMSAEEIATYTAELRFLRALNYFNLVRHWGAVPLRTEENMTDWDLPKSSVDEIYAFIVEDLKFASENCPDVPRLVGTPGKNAAKALLAEVYMYTKEYALAKQLSEEVISSNAYSLVSVSTVRDFDKVFGYDLVTSPEEVFYLKTSRTDGKTWDYISYTAHPQYQIEPGKRMLNGFGYYTHYTDLRNHVISTWDTDDLRYGLNVGPYVFGADAYGEYTALLTKYWDPNASGSGANVSIPLIRYSDVLITYAEASARVAGAPTGESIEALNMLRRRGYGYNPSVANAEVDYQLADYNSLDRFIDLLVKEETYERMNEAKHWDFILRLGKEKELVGQYFNVKDGSFTQIADRHYLWKIPDSEFNYNKALDQGKDQNPGY
ncbi:SusD-like starch-binding protein associating with outer membrane [Pontibacter mucosus]|uniref:SusD-like starch-binding protein associating with outer membrane n=1 Tax=Pontibacter mucosus TaxID=1649266 RepID=A0A2T5YHW7_9BACT|nr:RagB/SusD family nutrient uptake outer membrane protein [Pontibacter mucosus]PTX18916.1 SusD-like starch-binding protein associating with outer membrane [Pontibacter mucosus]